MKIFNLRTEDANEFTTCVTDWAGVHVGAAFKAANLVPTRCNHTINGVVVANDANVAVFSAAGIALRRSSRRGLIAVSKTAVVVNVVNVIIVVLIIPPMDCYVISIDWSGSSVAR